MIHILIDIKQIIDNYVTNEKYKPILYKSSYVDL